MTPRSRHILLYGTALATLAAVVFAPPEQETVQPAHLAPKPQAEADAAPIVAPSEALKPIPRNGLANEPNDMFLVDRPPPSIPAATASARQPVPVAPPLPFTYMGKMVENGALTVFLTREDKPYVVHAGDVLDNQYRIDAIRPPSIELTYLPLKQKQLLSMGETK